MPAGTGDAAWLRAFHAVVPGVVRAFRPEVLVTQHGTDSHREDPLADLNLSIDGQRTSYQALRRAGRNRHRRPVARAGRRRVLTGAGGAPGVDPPAGDRVRPRHRPGHPAARRMAVAGRGGPSRDATTGRHVRRHTAPGDLPRWDGTVELPVDRAILDTRSVIYPLHGLDPYDPRD